jgi:twitching motility protein PilT
MIGINLGAATIPERLQAWLARAVELGASDIHLSSGYPPAFRLHGELAEQREPMLLGEELDPILEAVAPPDVRDQLREHRDADFSFDVIVANRPARFRAHLFYSGGHLAACFRVIPTSIPSFEWAAFPMKLAERLAFQRDGLVIMTGPTGSGKTTTLALLVNLINETGGYRIITVEEPVEYVFPRARHSVVTQREVGTDVRSFADGLRAGLRQDPDVILVGEVRDRETAQMALSAAETGHLVFTTLHTRDAKGAISRFADFFPQESQSTVRAQLAMSLRAVISQRLLPDVDRAAKRHLAIEVLWNTNPIASSIRSGKLESIDNYLITNREEGMISFDESIRKLWRAGKITREVAERNVREMTILDR